ncbi:hypothetical protein [Lewinella sp. IMCC34191]|uniref:hypothetical protein n=1 Tax=Lewinella sp. IMCC34191 TaxID=2259172 RepID=UPI000E23AAC9|nr:hypothetical protein [Lewinella sp. IMCC34191]
MHLRLFLMLFFALSFSLYAQQNPSSEIEDSPWLFLEGRVSWVFTKIVTGRDYTTSENQSSQSVRLLARRNLGQHVGIGAGFGLGTRSFRLASTYDRYVRQNFPPNTPGDEINWFNRLDYSDMYVELPLEVRASLIPIGKGRIYLKGGTTWLIPVHTRNSNYRVLENQPEPTLMPDARLESPVTNFLNAGIGFLVKDDPAYEWYLELCYDWAAASTVRPVEPDQQDPRSRHFPELRAQQVGILFGIGF